MKIANYINDKNKIIQSKCLSLINPIGAVILYLDWSHHGVGTLLIRETNEIHTHIASSVCARSLSIILLNAISIFHTISRESD